MITTIEQGNDPIQLEPYSGGVDIERGSSLVYIEHRNIPRLITSLATMLTPEQLTQLMNELGKIAEEKEHQQRKLFRMLPDEVIKTILEKCKSLPLK